MYAVVMDKLRRIPFGREHGITDLANRMAVVYTLMDLEENFHEKYQGKRLIFFCECRFLILKLIFMQTI